MGQYRRIKQRILQIVLFNHQITRSKEFCNLLTYVNVTVLKKIFIKTYKMAVLNIKINKANQ